MRVLILEDNLDRIAQFAESLGDIHAHYVTRADDAITLLDSDEWDVLFLDHDLGHWMTGYHVACWLEEHPEKKPPLIIAHSMNPVGANRIMQALSGATGLRKWPGVFSDKNLGRWLKEAIESVEREYVVQSGKADGTGYRFE